MNFFLNQKIVKSGAAICLLGLTAYANAAPANTAPTDIEFGFPVDIVAGNELILVGNGGTDFGTYAGVGAADTDDSSDLIDVSPVFDAGLTYYGINYSGVDKFFVGSNGYVTLGSGASSYGFSLATWNNSPMFILHEGDWDPRGSVYGTSAGGNSTGTNDAFFHLDTINDIVTITYDDLDCYSAPCAGSAGALTAAQLRFHNLGSSNFVVEYRYENLGWGDQKYLGWSKGDAANFNRENKASVTGSNIGHPGVFAFMFVDGIEVLQGSIREWNVGGYAGSFKVTDPDPGETFTFELTSASDRQIFDIVVIDDVGYLRLIDNKNQGLATSYDVKVRATDSAGHILDKVMRVSVIKTPGFLTSSNIYANVDESFNTTIKVAVDPTSGIPDIDELDIPGWMSFSDNGDGTATISGFPSFENIFSVKLRMTTAGGVQYDKTFRLHVTIPTPKDDSTSDSTTVTVTTETSGSSGGSFGWLLLLISGSFFVRKK